MSVGAAHAPWNPGTCSLACWVANRMAWLLVETQPKSRDPIVEAHANNLNLKRPMNQCMC